ncbi:hypothetical protein ACFLTC_00280 [Chloroflexota bacterium]
MPYVLIPHYTQWVTSSQIVKSSLSSKEWIMTDRKPSTMDTVPAENAVRRECLDLFLILSERHLYRTVKRYQAYFNHARPHEGIDQHIPYRLAQPEEQQDMGIISHSVLGGLHHDRQRTQGGPSFPRAA